MNQALQTYLQRFAGIFFLLGLWILLSATNTLNPLFLPAPTEVTTALIQMTSSGVLLNATFASLTRIMIGFGIAIAVSIPLGLWIGINPVISNIGSPVISFIRYIPPSAFLALSLIWFGVGEPQKYFMVFIFTAPYLTVLVADCAATIPQRLIASARTMGIQGTRLYQQVIWPYAQPGIWDAIRLMLGAAWNAIVLTELVAVSSGLGAILIRSQRFLQMSDVFAVLLVLGTIGFILDWGMAVLRPRLFPWHQVNTP